MKIDIEIYSSEGGRAVNEDCVCVAKQQENVCVTVSDGLGGQGKGEIASDLVAKSICRSFQNSPDSDEFLMEAFQAAQEALVSRKKELGEMSSMMTTAVSLIIMNHYAQWAHIGDSRLYYFQNYKLICRTLDHSVPQMLVSQHKLREKKIRYHPERNKLLRAMGVMNRKIECTVSERLPLENGMSFLLCSDGFWECITERKMIHTLRHSQSAAQWLEQMVKLIKKDAKADQDNYTAAAIRIYE